MTEGRRLSNRSSIRTTGHLISESTGKQKGGRFKFRNGIGSQSPSKQHINASSTVIEVQSIDDIATSNGQEQVNRLTSPPSKHINYESPKINVRSALQTISSSKNVFKLDVPMQNEVRISVSATLSDLIDKKRNISTYLTICGDENYAFESLRRLPAQLNQFLTQKMGTQSTPQRQTSRFLCNRVDQLLAQENQFLSPQDSTDLSFDGKALNKNDIFKIVDSFSVAFDDNDDEAYDDQYIKQPRNILPREVTGVF